MTSEKDSWKKTAGAILGYALVAAISGGVTSASTGPDPEEIKRDVKEEAKEDALDLAKALLAAQAAREGEKVGDHYAMLAKRVNENTRLLRRLQGVIRKDFEMGAFGEYLYDREARRVGRDTLEWRLNRYMDPEAPAEDDVGPPPPDPDEEVTRLVLQKAEKVAKKEGRRVTVPQDVGLVPEHYGF